MLSVRHTHFSSVNTPQGTPLYSPRPIWHAGTEGLGLYSEDECRAVHAEWAARQPDARTRPEPSPPPPAATTAGPTATARAATASSTTTASAQSPQVPPVPVALPASHAVDEDAAARFICEQAEHYPGRVVVCSLGALTNVARALRLRPGVGALLQRVVFMGAGVRVTVSRCAGPPRVILLSSARACCGCLPIL